MSILQKIINHKTQEVTLQKGIKPIKLLEKNIYFEMPVVSMRQYLQRTDKVGIIAEIKRSSPSTGMIKGNVDVAQLSSGYIQAGATALSVLTDKEFFAGSNEDLTMARKFNSCPILRKDFIIDEYQLVEAKSIGADCILLIAACLTPESCRELAAFARSLGLEVLLEVHNKTEIESHVNGQVDIVGVNNRNLHDFSTDIATSISLAPFISHEFIKISESGIHNAAQIIELKSHGFQGFLIGGHFMKQGLPEKACQQLIQEVSSIKTT
jgi:indole-3-glycerol phosphate synthase